MHKTRRNLIRSAVLIAVTVYLIGCGEPATSVSGVVRDESEKPLADVTIVMESALGGGFAKESEQKTKPDGSYNFVTITGSAKNVRLTFSKAGYKEVQREMPAGQESTADVILGVE